MYLFLSCHVSGCVLYLFLEVSWLDMRSVVVSFPGHTHILVEAESFFRKWELCFSVA